VRHHLVKLRQPYLGRILDGSKTIESRFTRTRKVPIGQIDPGDALWLKLSGGPVLGYAEVERFEVFDRLTPRTIRGLFTRHARAIGVGPAYAEHVSHARFGLLVWLKGVKRIEPFPMRGGTMQAWVILDGPPGPSSGRAITLTVTGGMLRNNYIRFPDDLDFFPVDSLGDRRPDGRRGRPIEVVFPAVETIQTDIVRENKAFRTRGPVGRFLRHHRIGEGDRLVIRRLGARRYRCEPASLASGRR